MRLDVLHGARQSRAQRATMKRGVLSRAWGSPSGTLSGSSGPAREGQKLPSARITERLGTALDHRDGRDAGARTRWHEMILFDSWCSVCRGSVTDSSTSSFERSRGDFISAIEGKGKARGPPVGGGSSRMLEVFQHPERALALRNICDSLGPE